MDTDSEATGNQDVLTEGDSGSGVSVSAAFWDATSSVISSATTVTLNTAVQTPAGAGKAAAADFSYAPTFGEYDYVPGDEYYSVGVRLRWLV